jgi:hypothetical protein
MRDMTALLRCVVDRVNEMTLPTGQGTSNWTMGWSRHVERTIYHLDGPGALRHLDRLLAIPELDCAQWIQGADLSAVPGREQAEELTRLAARQEG